MTNPSSKRICIGKIATVHGVRGLVKITVYADDPHLLDRHGPVFTGEQGNDTLAVTLKNPMNKHWIGEIEGITDRDAAETLRDTELWIDRDCLPPTDEDEYYVSDLIGMTAIDADGQAVGTIIAVDNFGAGDLLEIKPAAGASFYLPFISDYVPEIRKNDGQVIITPPEDWIEG